MLLALVLFACPLFMTEVRAQDEGAAGFCAPPELKVEPTWTIEPIGEGPRIVHRRAGVRTDTTRPETETNFELILAADVPTEIPRTGLTLEAIWIPLAETESNPFTGTTAQGLDEPITENPVELEAELNVTVLRPEDTDGWVEMHADLVEKFSPAERPGADSWYTSKLNLELDTAVLPFHGLPEQNWFRHLEVEGSIDYVATGIPRAGDTFPGDGPRYLDDANPWGFSLVVVIPLAPRPRAYRLDCDLKISCTEPVVSSCPSVAPVGTTVDALSSTGAGPSGRIGQGLSRTGEPDPDPPRDRPPISSLGQGEVETLSALDQPDPSRGIPRTRVSFSNASGESGEKLSAESGSFGTPSRRRCECFVSARPPDRSSLFEARRNDSTARACLRVMWVRVRMCMTIVVQSRSENSAGERALWHRPHVFA